MNEEAYTKSKDRSPNFPFINLETALHRAQQFYKEEKRGSAPFAGIAHHWGYSVSSSGCKQTAAALMSYGLMDDEGSGPQRTFRLTELAFRILLDQRPDSQERADYLREAAVKPSVAADVYAKWHDGLPSSATLHHYLVFDRSFNDTSAVKVAKILIENHQFVGFGESGSSLHDTEQSEDMQSLSRHQVQANQVPSPMIPSAAAADADALTERIYLLGGEVVLTIQYSGKKGFQAFDQIEKYGKLRKALEPTPVSQEDESKKILD